MPEILVTGCRGLLGSALMAHFGARACGMDLPEIDITDRFSVTEAVRRTKPGLIINTAALTDVDYCQTHPDRAFQVHADGVRNLAETGIRLLTFSTDHVFTEGTDPITEGAKPFPANAYGESKLSGEAFALAFEGNAVIRTSWLCSGDRGILPWIRKGLLSGSPLRAVKDQTACVTLSDHLVRAVVEIIDSDGNGVFHCVNSGSVTPYELAGMIRARLNKGAILGVTWKELGVPAPRPRYSALGTERSVHLPPLEEAFEEWMRIK